MRLNFLHIVSWLQFSRWPNRSQTWIQLKFPLPLTLARKPFAFTLRTKKGTLLICSINSSSLSYMFIRIIKWIYGSNKFYRHHMHTEHPTPPPPPNSLTLVSNSQYNSALVCPAVLHHRILSSRRRRRVMCRCHSAAGGCCRLERTLEATVNWKKRQHSSSNTHTTPNERCPSPLDLSTLDPGSCEAAQSIAPTHFALKIEN